MAYPPKSLDSAKTGKVTAAKIDLLQAFGHVKKRFTDIKREDAYYAVLNKHGVKKSNEFTNDAAGRKTAVAAFKELELVVADLEIPRAAIATATNHPNWDAAEAAVGRGDAEIVVDGIRYELVDGNYRQSR